jgi:hypothetical protein
MYATFSSLFGALVSIDDPAPNLSMREFVYQSQAELDRKLSSYYDYYYKSCYDYKFDHTFYTTSAAECGYSASSAHGISLQAAATSYYSAPASTSAYYYVPASYT